MRFENEADGRAWLAGLGADSLGSLAARAPHGSWKIPSDAGRRAALAKQLCRLASKIRGPRGLHISGFGIWPSGENPALYYAVRRSFGDDRPLRVASWHLFEEDEDPALECFLDLVLYFLWDASLYLPDIGWRIDFSHDEVFELYAGNQDAASISALDFLETLLAAEPQL